MADTWGSLLYVGSLLQGHWELHTLVRTPLRRFVVLNVRLFGSATRSGDNGSNESCSSDLGPR